MHDNMLRVWCRDDENTMVRCWKHDITMLKSRFHHRTITFSQSYYRFIAPPIVDTQWHDGENAMSSITASSNIEIQNFQESNFELQLFFEPARRLTFKKKNELELNFHSARRLKFKNVQTRISTWSWRRIPSWCWILSQHENINSNIQNPNLELELNFEQARRSKFEI
jgi:hypothetical protein